MSGQQGCRCETKSRRGWYLVHYKCNYSAFNGHRHTPSKYSEVACVDCEARWRTKAAYVDALPTTKPRAYFLPDCTAEPSKVGITPRGLYLSAGRSAPDEAENTRAWLFEKTGAFRPPRKGEWYLRGPLLEAYCAPNNLSTKFHIVKRVP